MEEVNMKKLLVLIGGLLVLTGCKQAEEIDLSIFKDYIVPVGEHAYEVEYGTEYNVNNLKFQLLKGAINVDIPEVDTMTVGDTEYWVTVDGHEHIVNISVVDTQAPVIKGDLKYTITEGDTLELNKKITAEDPVDGKVDVEFSEFDNKKIGVQKVTAVAKDVNGNETKAEVEITVEEKVVVQSPVNKPSGGSSSGGSTSKPSGNTGGNSGSNGNSGNTSKPSGGSSSSETWPGKNEGYDRDGWKTLGTLKSKGEIITIEHDLYGKSNHIMYSTDSLFIIIAPGETEWGYNSVISSGGGSSESAAILYEAAHEHYEANGYINR